MSEFKSTNREEFICISYYDTEDLPIDSHCIKYRSIKYDIQEVLERTDDIDYVISDSKTTRNLLKENDKLKEEIERLKEELGYTIPIVEHNKTITKHLKENKRLNNIVNELEKLLKEEKTRTRYANDVERFTAYDFALKRLQELKGEDKE